MTTVAYRHAQWDTPWWVNANRSAGRYNRATDAVTQYWCLHPLGPTAEFLRWSGPATADDIGAIRLRLWAARVPTDGLVRVDFDTAPTFGISAEDLVAEDCAATQDLAERLRSDGAPGFFAPSAVLPGTEILVLFGARLLFPYLLDPVDVEDQVPTAHAAETSVADEVVAWVRWKGEAHRSLEEWQRTGVAAAWEDPPVAREAGEQPRSADRARTGRTTG